MPRIRLTFESLTLFNDEESGPTHMRLYAEVRDISGRVLENFYWNNRGAQVNESPLPFGLSNDPTNPNVLELELSSPTTIMVSGLADDDQEWPSPSNFENDLGTASVTFDPSSPSMLGDLVIGPTTTDNGNPGFQVQANAIAIPERFPRHTRIHFDNLILYNDKEMGSTHMAVYVYAQTVVPGGGLIFSWNNGGQEVDEVNIYELTSGGTNSTVDLNLSEATDVVVEGFADDDQDWPSSDNNENDLGSARITIDPYDPNTLGRKQLGPTFAHGNGGDGYEVNLRIETFSPVGPFTTEGPRRDI